MLLLLFCFFLFRQPVNGVVEHDGARGVGVV